MAGDIVVRHEHRQLLRPDPDLGQRLGLPVAVPERRQRPAEAIVRGRCAPLDAGDGHVRVVHDGSCHRSLEHHRVDQGLLEPVGDPREVVHVGEDVG